MVADGHHTPEDIESRERTVADVLDMIGSTAPRLMVFNKIDLVDKPGRLRLRALHPDAVLIAAASGDGLTTLEDRIAEFFEHALERVRLLIPYAESGLVARLRGVAADIREEGATQEGLVINAQLAAPELARYAAYRIDDDTDVS